mmetsp:Transcript_56063/g.91265  ORF Transcript_56063/g.91265 Transcript_56063/m.91265 type:complete len:439 (-) Transcript_56063:87-1403(-)
MSAFSDELTAVELPELPVTRPGSSSSCSIFSVQADSMAANARLVEEYLSSLELFESQDPQPALPATAPETAPETALPGMDVPVVAVSTSSQTDQKDEQHCEAQTESPALQEPSEHPESRKELEHLEHRDEEAQTEVLPLVQDSKETQTVEEQLDPAEPKSETQSQPVDVPPAVELQEAQTQTENQTAQDSKETQTTSEDYADLEHPTDVATSVAMEETLEVDAVSGALATGNSTVTAASPAEETAWMTRVHQLREQESPVHLAPWDPSSRPDPDVVAKLLGIDPHRPAQRGPVVPPLDFGKVQMGEVGIYDFSASMSKARSELTRASSDGRLGPAFTEPLALSSSSLEELTPEERYQLFVRRIRQKHLGTPKVSPFARPLTLAPLKDHFAFKKKRKSPSQSYFSPGDVIGMPMEEQLHSHFHHHFHLRNDVPAISEES